MHDLVIVGAGPAGLAAAYYLRDLDLYTLILETGPEVGGRTRSASVAGVPSNTGALFVCRGTPAEALAHEHRVRTVPFVPATYGVHLNGTTVVDSDTGRLIDRLDLSPTARQQLRDFIDSALIEYRALTDGGQLTDVASQLADERAADRLVGLDPPVAQIITGAVQGGSVADPSRLSAQYALRVLRQLPGSRVRSSPVPDRRNAGDPAGTGRRLARRHDPAQPPGDQCERRPAGPRPARA